MALLAITTCGFPTAVAGLSWIDAVLASKRVEQRGRQATTPGAPAELHVQPMQLGGEPL